MHLFKPAEEKTIHYSIKANKKFRSADQRVTSDWISVRSNVGKNNKNNVISRAVYFHLFFFHYLILLPCNLSVLPFVPLGWRLNILPRNN